MPRTPKDRLPARNEYGGGKNGNLEMESAHIRCAKPRRNRQNPVYSWGRHDTALPETELVSGRHMLLSSGTTVSCSYANGKTLFTLDLYGT